jgi:hypothetical protein
MAESLHGPECGCVRCVGFQPGHTLGAQPGNQLGVRHGAFSMIRLEPRVDELVEQIRELVPAYRPPDDVTIHLLAIPLARIEAIYAAVAAGDLDDVEHLEARLRSWVNSARQSADKLGLNPTARGRLGLDVAQTRRALTLMDLHADAELERPPELSS